MEKTFEQKMQELDEIVAKLEESKGLDLNEVAALYKRGKDLSKELQEQLNTLKSSVAEEIVK